MFEILSHTSESLFSSCYLVLIVRVTCYSSYGKILAEPHYQLNDSEFAKYCDTPLTHRF